MYTVRMYWIQILTYLGRVYTVFDGPPTLINYYFVTLYLVNTLLTQ